MTDSRRGNMSKDFDKEEFIADLYVDMLRDLKTRIREGTASPQDRKLIEQIAQRHNVDVDTTAPNNPLTGTTPDVPFTMEDLTSGAEDDTLH